MIFPTDESARRCPRSSSPAASVQDREELALLVRHPELCDESGMPTEGAFELRRLMLSNAATAQYPHDCCGHSEGVSLERTAKDRAEDVERRSTEMAARKGGKPMGAAISCAQALRDIRLPARMSSTKPGKTEIADDEQVVFVLADGGEQNIEHAVLRIHPNADRMIAKQIVGLIRKEFMSFAAWMAI